MFEDFQAAGDFADSMDSHLWDAVDPYEVEAVVSVLNDLIEQVDNATLQVYLHAACDEIRGLVTDLEENEDDALAA